MMSVASSKPPVKPNPAASSRTKVSVPLTSNNGPKFSRRESTMDALKMQIFARGAAMNPDKPKPSKKSKFDSSDDNESSDESD